MIQGRLKTESVREKSEPAERLDTSESIVGNVFFEKTMERLKRENNAKKRKE